MIEKKEAYFIKEHTTNTYYIVVALNEEEAFQLIKEKYLTNKKKYDFEIREIDEIGFQISAEVEAL